MPLVVQHNPSDALDAEYRVGRPQVYLTPQELARVLIARSKLGDTRADPAAVKSASPTADTEGV